MKKYARSFILFFFGLILTSVLFSAFFYMTGGWFVRIALPVCETIMRSAYPGGELDSLSAKNISGHEIIVASMTLKKYFQGVSIPLIDTLNTSITSSILFVPFVIYYALLFAWPFVPLKNRLIAALITTPFVVLFFLLDMPVTLVSAIELAEQKKLIGYAVRRSFITEALVFLSHFFNNGGRQFAGVFFFIISVAPWHLSNSKKKK